MNSWLNKLFVPSLRWHSEETQENHESKSLSPCVCKECGHTAKPRPSLPQYSMSEVGDHWSADSCWIVLHDKVYDVTEFLYKHPGGMEIILECGGRDATVPFSEVGHGKATALLRKYLIGELVENERIEKSSTKN